MKKIQMEDPNLKKMFIITILFFIFLVFMLWVSFRKENRDYTTQETIKIKEAPKVDYKVYDNAMESKG